MKYLLRIFIVILLTGLWLPLPSWCQQAERDSLRISEYPLYETYWPGDIIKFGILTGFVFTEELDTGMDIGGRVSQRFFHPYFKLTSQLHFWAASKENRDLGVVGIEESITYQIPLVNRLSGYGGFALNYLAILEKERIYNGTDFHETTKRKNRFEPYILFGLEYSLDINRSAFFEWKIGSTAFQREIQLILGLHFYRIKGATADAKQSENPRNHSLIKPSS
jgi:hypothetical protein